MRTIFICLPLSNETRRVRELYLLLYLLYFIYFTLNFSDLQRQCTAARNVLEKSGTFAHYVRIS